MSTSRKFLVPSFLVPSFLAMSFVVLAAATAFATGHGPVFGYATPVNSAGEWSFDAGLNVRHFAPGTDLVFRNMVSYGFTPHVQWSFNLPAYLESAPGAPTRTMGMGDWESNLAWRFHHNATSVGTRFESTASAGLVVPGPQSTPGAMGMLRRAPGLNVALATGMASRSHYLWAGGGYTWFAAKQGDQRPAVFSYSLVWGYRPPSWRKHDYPAWDWRLFAEMTGDAWGHAQHLGAPMPATHGHTIFLGPSTLGIYKSFAISGGVQFPVYQQIGSAFPRERVRVAVNLSYFLFTNHKQHGD
jgi:hypothetical protein